MRQVTRRSGHASIVDAARAHRREVGLRGAERSAPPVCSPGIGERFKLLTLVLPQCYNRNGFSRRRRSQQEGVKGVNREV
jgi:hypothetical protein